MSKTSTEKSQKWVMVRRYHLKKLFHERYPDREEREKKKERLAKKLGVSADRLKAYWNIRYYKDTADIGGVRLRIIAKFFGVTMEALFNDQKEKY